MAALFGGGAKKDPPPPRERKPVGKIAVAGVFGGGNKE